MTCPNCGPIRPPAPDADDVSPAHLEALAIIAYSDGTDGQTRAAAYLITMGPEAVAEAVARAYEEGRGAGQRDQLCGRTHGARINARARAGAALVEAREAVKKAQTALRHAGGKSRRETAERALATVEERLRQAENDYLAARAAEESA